MLSLEHWVDHLLRSADPRWREHTFFPFVAFNLIQKQRIWKSCNRLLKAKSVEAITAAPLLVTPKQIDAALKDLQEAEYTKGCHSFNDIEDVEVRTVFKQLFKNMHTVTRQLDLTDTAKLNHRKMLYSKQIFYGLPDLWITINPRHPCSADMFTSLECS